MKGSNGVGARRERIKAHEGAHDVAQSGDAKCQSSETGGKCAMPPCEDDAECSQRHEWNHDQQGVCYV